MIWLLLLPQDVDVLLERLGHPDPEARLEAEEALRRLGRRALDGLRGASRSADPERALRARDVLADVEEAARLDEIVARERPDRIGFLASAAPRRPGTAAVDGVRFTITRHPWPTGTIFVTSVERELAGDLEWTVAGASAGRPLAVETCARHSPGRIFVPESSLDTPTLTLRGLRRWYCPVPVDFEAPRDGERRRVGDFSVTLQWPRVLLRSKRPRAVETLEQLLLPHDIQVWLRPGVPSHETLMFFHGCEKRFRALAPREGAPAWCGCRGGPSSVVFPPPPIAQDVAFDIPDYECHRIGDVERLTLTLRIPVEEPFEVTTLPLD